MNQPIILAIETALHQCSVALQLANGQRDFLATSQNFMQSEMLVCLIEQLLNKHGIWYTDLDFIACTVGPGSFAGVRAGIAAVRTIRTLVPTIKALGFGTLDVLAFGASLTQGPTVVCLQHRNNFYWAEVLDSALAAPQVAKTTEFDWNKLANNTSKSQSTTTIVTTARIETAPNSIAQQIIPLDASAVLNTCQSVIERKQTESYTDLTPLYVGEPNVSVPRK